MNLDGFIFDAGEKSNMTFQVALVGKEGAVVASDTKAVNETSVRRVATPQRKILYSANAVCAVAGASYASDMASELLKEMSKKSATSTEQLYEQANGVYKTYDPEIKNAMANSTILVAARESNEIKLWYLSIYGKVFVDPPNRYLIGGDRHNPAVGVIEIYYDNPLDKSIEALKSLAAYAVLQGHISNPTYVDGLDVLVWRNGEEPKFLEDQELDSLKDNYSVLCDPFILLSNGTK